MSCDCILRFKKILEKFVEFILLNTKCKCQKTLHPIGLISVIIMFMDSFSSFYWQLNQSNASLWVGLQRTSSLQNSASITAIQVEKWMTLL